MDELKVAELDFLRVTLELNAVLEDFCMVTDADSVADADFCRVMLELKAS